MNFLKLISMMNLVFLLLWGVAQTTTLKGNKKFFDFSIIREF